MESWGQQTQHTHIHMYLSHFTNDEYIFAFGAISRRDRTCWTNSQTRRGLFSWYTQIYSTFVNKKNASMRAHNNPRVEKICEIRKKEAIQISQHSSENNSLESQFNNLFEFILASERQKRIWGEEEKTRLQTENGIFLNSIKCFRWDCKSERVCEAGIFRIFHFFVGHFNGLFLLLLAATSPLYQDD